MARRFRPEWGPARPIPPTVKLSSQAIGSQVVLSEAANHGCSEVLHELSADEAVDLAESLLEAAGEARPR